MRPTGGMRLKLGHEQAGLRDVLVPVRARLGIALLGLEIVLIAHAVLLPLE